MDKGAKMKGKAYVFLRKDSVPMVMGYAGHIAWGFTNEDGKFYFGSTDNSRHNPVIRLGKNNGWWAETAETEAEMLEKMTEKNYDGYKVATVRNFDVPAAHKVADGTKSFGYSLMANNCLNHVWYVLNAYGVKDLPLLGLNSYPNQWFALFNGEYHNL